MSPSAPALSADLLTRIRQVLADHGIDRTRLTAGQPRLNLNAYDKGRVFVKVNRPGERHGRAHREVLGAQWAHQHGIISSVPLIPHVLDVRDEHGEVRDLTVWQWLDSCTAPPLYDQARTIADLLARISQTPPPPDTTAFDLSFFLDRIHARLDGRSEPVAATLVDAAEKSASDIAERLDPERYTWIHGDLHAENLLWQVTGRPRLLDWESHAVGPVEWDVAQLFRSVYLDFPRHAVSEKERSVSAAARRLDQQIRIDWDLVEAFGRFRAASSASHRHLHGQDPHKQALDVRMVTSVPFAHAAVA